MTLVAYFQGDSIFLTLSKARKITRDDYPKLYNVVEEMKIASGLEKMPNIYVIDDPALNAFATGRDPNKASVAITSGLLQKLNRDELQGVIGHEIAHIRNRDVLLMAVCGVLLGTIVILAWYASRILIFGGMTRGRRSSSGGGGQAQIIILIVGLVLMILAPIAAQFIYFAISRKREYLADASSALYTRYPEGLASALEKLGGSTAELKSANKATAPMYIVNPFRPKAAAGFSSGQAMKASDLSSTHPPISERVRILRAMAGGASFKDYNNAFKQVHGGGSAISGAALAGAGTVGIRAASSEGPVVDAKSEKKQRTREVSDVMERLNNYRTVTCECGTKWKVPPAYGDDKVLCTRCGRTLKLR
jgi:heat shock protein HtpX